MEAIIHRAKVKRERNEAVQEFRPHASVKHIRISPYKVRSVINLVRGKGYFEAVAILTSIVKSACEPVLKILNSAAANAENKGMMKKDLYVAEIFADGGPVMKRTMPRARGSADRILKRTSHITVILDTKEAK